MTKTRFTGGTRDETVNLGMLTPSVMRHEVVTHWDKYGKGPDYDFNNRYYLFKSEDYKDTDRLSISMGETTQRWSVPSWLVMA